MLRVRLLTSGSPSALTGGHRYQRRMQEAASGHDAVIEFSQARFGAPLPRDADVVAVDSITAWRLVVPVARRHRDTPVVAVVHQPPGGVDAAAVRRRAQAILDRFVYRRCDALIVAGAPLAEQLVSHCGLAAERVHVIPPGCDLPAGRRVGDLRAGRRIAVACVANWYPNKGLLDLLEAVAALPDDDVTVHLAGRDDVDPSYTESVRARLRAPDLAGRVEVHGPLEPQGIADLYAGADALVLPSRAETYSTVVAEALAAGLPIVAWRSTHIEQMVSDGVEGLLVSPGDVAGLASVMRTLANDSIGRARLADAARRRGRQLPRWSDTAAAFFAVLRGVVSHAVEPAHDRAARLEVDATDARVLDEQAPADLVTRTEGPRQRGLDGADVRDDHHETGLRDG